MSYLWFTADIHAGHYNVMDFCNRTHDTDMIIRNMNERIKDNDVILHVGDFCFTGGLNGTAKAADYENKLNGKWIFIEGNHDKNNKLKGMLHSVTIAHSGLRMLIRHIPPETVSDDFDLVICGHVHNAWKHKFVDGKPIINVGVDVWNFRPVRIDELVKYYRRIIKENGNKS